MRQLFFLACIAPLVLGTFFGNPWDHKENYPPAPTPPTPDNGSCAAFDGIPCEDGRKCCPAHCGKCGGIGCEKRPGGALDCCTFIILKPCKYHNAPCVLDPHSNPTPAPSTPKPTTPKPSTPAPSTPAPSTPAPSTAAPSTPKPTTPAPSTPKPTTPAPSTPAPTTPAPSTPAPSTPKPTTPAPSTPKPTTPAPSTPKPTTPAPSTPKPTTPAPSTPKPTTPAPSTPKPTTPAPSTPAPSTPAPSTPAPSTPKPTTPAPSTPAPSTPVPSTPKPTTPVLSTCTVDHRLGACAENCWSDCEHVCGALGVTFSSNYQCSRIGGKDCGCGYPGKGSCCKCDAKETYYH